MAIPQVIVQTHRDENISAEHRASWIEKNPDFEYRFFDDAQCRDFFVQQMPGLLDTYDKLPKAVQKADLFRYAYIYRFGGVYSDVDTVCETPLSSYLPLERDCLIAGIEMSPADYKFNLKQYTEQFISPFQVLQWTFAASPNHIALAVMLDRIRFYVNTLSAEQLSQWSQADRFTLEVTGPMMFSQVVHDCLSGSRPGEVLLLDQLAWGYNPWLNRTIENPNENIKVRHLFHGSWKTSQQ